MCGIYGIYKFKNAKTNSVEVDRMSTILKHRGPDANGEYINENVGLGHRRLSILDLSPLGKQPMQVEDNLWITFNGEIYNYIELREELITKGYKFRSTSDTEVILNMYEEYGEACLEKMRGMFSLAIYNKSKRSLFCARDRFGIKPFYYYKDDSKFYFASEIKGIFADPSIPRKPNDKLIYDFLFFNRTDHSEETCFEEIYNLRPGHYILITSNDFKIEQWYKVPDIEPQKLETEEHITNFRNTLLESLRIHLRSDVPIGSALSGGLDSSTIVCLMRKELPKNEIHSFSAIYDEKWEKNEKEYMDAVIDKCDLESHTTTPTGEELLQKLEKLIYHQEEPFGSSSIFAGWKVMELTNKHKIKVMLNGQGADEILGYDYMAAFYFYELLTHFKLITLIKELYFFVTKQKYGVKFTLQLFAFLLAPGFLKNKLIYTKNNWLSKEFFEKYKNESDFASKFFNVKTFNNSVRNHLLYKLNHLLRVEDKNSMAFSIETRVPFLDHVLVEETLKVPSSLKIKNGVLKYILRKSVQDEIPAKVYNRNNKIGFETPEAEWFRTEDFHKFISKIINSESFEKRGYFDIEKLKQMLAEHKSCEKNWSRQLWKAIFIETWFKIFIDPSKLIAK